MTTQSRQKSYEDVRKRELEFEVDDYIFMKVSPTKEVMRFRKKGKLSPIYVGAYKIGDVLKCVATKVSLCYEDMLVEILNSYIRRLRNNEVASVKVLWMSQSVKRATWEAEAAIKAKNPHLFPSNSAPT